MLSRYQMMASDQIIDSMGLAIQAPAVTAVTAISLCISSALQPRERSFAGRALPAAENDIKNAHSTLNDSVILTFR